MQTMTPAELLAPDAYALAYFERGRFMFVVETFGNLEAAQAVCKQHKSTKSRRYVVVEIAKEAPAC